ncbi:MAG: LytTR family DNA-binding domain-containing protein, partial [Pseudomonadota bacterium]
KQMICFFAAGQLISEALRGLVAYSYPVHDLRLFAIAAFSLAFALSVAFHILRTFGVQHALRWVGGLAAISLIAMLATKGFDFKALVGMAIPLLGSLIATGVWSYQRRARAFVYFIALLLFLLAIVLFQGLFLDTVFFLLVAFFLLLLFLEQALALASEERERRSEEARANRLEQALAEAEQRAESSHINVKSAGKLERIAANQVVHCSGAGGYSEIHLLGGRTLLHSVSLNELEESLPAIFLRVHRSHLINVMFVEALTRDPSGTGSLRLQDDVSVPVSRRIMPKVREALG